METCPVTRIPLALDPGDRTGWALAKPGLAKPRAGFVDMPDAGKDIGKWANAFEDWLMPFARLEGVTDIVSEAPIIALHGGNPDINVVVKHVGILIVAAKVADRLELPPVVRANRSTVCKHFTAVGAGKRRELKARCLLHCQTKGWAVTDENVADAIATLDWFVHDRGIDVGWDCQPCAGPLFTAEQGMKGTRIDKDNKIAAAVLLNKVNTFNGSMP